MANTSTKDAVYQGTCSTTCKVIATAYSSAWALFTVRPAGKAKNHNTGRGTDLDSQVVAVQSLSRVWLFVTLWTAARQASLSFTISQSLLKLMSIESLMLSNHLILCHPLLLLPSIFPSIRAFFNESVLRIRWSKYWSFSIRPSIEYSGLISFRIDWFDLHAVQGTLKSLFQHHSSKASILWHSAFLMVQLSHPYIITEKL